MCWVQETGAVTGNWLQYLGAETGALGSGFWGLVGLGIGKQQKTVLYAESYVCRRRVSYLSVPEQENRANHRNGS